jgi:hypothetical protein
MLRVKQKTLITKKEKEANKNPKKQAARLRRKCAAPKAQSDLYATQAAALVLSYLPWSSS